MFSILQCQNPDCQFRFSVDLDAKYPRTCPKCKSALREVEPPFSGRKITRTSQTAPVPRIEVMLDNIRSTFNVGAMFRSCDGAQIAHIHLCGTSPTPEHPKIAKTSLGAELSVPWSYHRNGLQAAQHLKDRGYLVWSLEGGENAVSLFKSRLPSVQPPLLLVVGNEVTGVDPGILRISDQIVYLPMSGAKESLNVAIAFGIAVYFLRFKV